MKIISFFCFLIYTIPAFSQSSLNTELIGNINYGREVNDVWGYIDENGNDYALVGLMDGISIVKVDSNQVQEVDFVSGVQSIWRDLKTHSHYAYVTADQGNSGLTIIDLSPLPGSVRLVNQLTTYFERAHNLYIANGFAYISGSNTSRGVDILDLSDPELPVRVGGWIDDYFHDIFTKGDTLYGSSGSSSRVIVLDISDKTNPTQITQIPFPDGGYSHNSWSTEDGNYLLTTQETGGRTVKMWDVRDLNDPKLVHEYLSNPGQLAHNAHIKGDYAYISHYADGLRILDISDPGHMVEVGYYDTNPSEQTGFDGNWGAFPFTASNYIYASDREFGLFVLSFQEKKASRISGKVVDSNTGLAIANVFLEIVELGQKSSTDDDGNYKLGMPSAGTYSVLLSKFGYESQITTITVEDSATITLDINLTPKKTGNLLGLVIDNKGQAISDAKIQIINTPFVEVISAVNGEFEFLNIPEDSYTIVIGKWGYKAKFIDVTIIGEISNNFDFSLDKGYSDNFELDLGWEIGDGSSNFQGPWKIVDPVEIGFGLPFHPNNDATPEPGKNAFFARTFSSELQLISPTFDLRDAIEATINYSFYWLPRGGNGDLLIVDISSDTGQTWFNLETYSDQNATSDWTKAGLIIPGSIFETEFMKVKFTTIENGSSSSFALIDDFEIITDTFNQEMDIPQNYKLFQNYPNPFNGETLILFSIPKEDHSTLKIFNVLGEEIITLVDEVLQAGDYVYAWNGVNKFQNQLSSGVYFYQLKTRNFEKTHKMLFME